MSSAVIASLGLDQPDHEDVIMAVVERGTADSTFLLSSIMWEWLVGRSSRSSRLSGLLIPKENSPKGSVCLVTSHQSLSHFQNIGIKLGYNLTNLQQQGLFEVHDILKDFAEIISNRSIESSDLQNIYHNIRNSIKKLLEKSQYTCLIIGNIDDFLNAGMHIEDLLIFVNYLYGLMDDFTGLSVFISMHECESDEEQAILAASIRHSSNLCVIISSLLTGLSKDVSGVMTISKEDACESVYHYRLLDREIKVFAPGTVGM